MKNFLPKRYRSNKFIYYSYHLPRLLLPKQWFRWRRESILNSIDQHDVDAIQARVDYYHPMDRSFRVDEKAATYDRLPLCRSTIYSLDLKESMRYFPRNLRFNYLFGDVTRTFEQPTIVKSRPIDESNSNSIVMKLNKLRHFNFIDDPWNYHAKKPRLIWRGAVYRPHRQRALAALFDKPSCDVGQTNWDAENPAWYCPKMSIFDQLGYKYILSIEGNDVASNLKWILSSNSLCFMTKPKYETWFMEGRLIAGEHYVELKDDYSDIDEKIAYYNQHPSSALEIIDQAHRYVAQFKHCRQEQLISLLVLDKYFRLSGQR